METKQTAVEWLIEQIENNPDMELYAESQRIKSQALQMEKEQIIMAHYQGYRNFIDTTEISEQYYNEIYGKETDRS